MIQTQETIVKFENVTKKFGEFTAVESLNLEIYRGEILGYLGENGAGKSTTMKMLGNLLRPNNGTIYIRDNGGGLEPLSSMNKDRLLNNIGFLIENPAFYGDMTPRAILRYFGELKGYSKKSINKRVEEIVEMIGMTQWIDSKIKNFSKGMRQKIGIISAIVHDPDIIVLDEPATGLDPTARLMVREFILKLKSLGKTVFLSSHLLYEISELADRIGIISHGKLVAIDTLENLEAMGKLSIIHLELNVPKEEIDSYMPIIAKVIQPYRSEEKKMIGLDRKTGIIKISFDGEPAHQTAILKALLDEGLNVIEFSVPKAGLLEDLYIEFVNKRQEELE